VLVHVSEAPSHVPFGTHESDPRASQQVWVLPSQVAAPHAIFVAGAPEDEELLPGSPGPPPSKPPGRPGSPGVVPPDDPPPAPPLDPAPEPPDELSVPPSELEGTVEPPHAASSKAAAKVILMYASAPSSVSNARKTITRVTTIHRRAPRSWIDHDGAHFSEDFSAGTRGG
jgi:hypothetical protein